MSGPLDGASVTPTTLTTSVAVNSLLDGYHWSNPTVSFSFIVPGSSYYSLAYPDPDFWSGISAFNNTQQNSARNALTAWSNVANLHFTEVADSFTSAGTIRLGFSYSHAWFDAAGETYLPSAGPAGGDLWLNPTATNSRFVEAIGQFSNSAFSNGTYSYNALLHELGHAIGLKHPFESSTDGGGGSLSGTSFAGYDSNSLTLMSYTTSQTHPDAQGFSFYPTTPMLLDIAAAQAIYGVNHGYNAGDTIYSFNDNPGQYYHQTIWDGGGSNSISYSGTTASTIDLRQGHGSEIGNPIYAYTFTDREAYPRFNVWIAYGTDINKATVFGSADCTLIANSNDCILQGGSGNDQLVAGSGNDILDGGLGFNTAVLAGNRAMYSIRGTGYGFQLADSTHAHGVDNLLNIQQIKFDDVQVSLSTITNTEVLHSFRSAYTLTNNGDSTAMLYDSQLSRDGISHLASGKTAVMLAFADNTTFVTSAVQGNVALLYKGALDRIPDLSGLNFWLATAGNLSAADQALGAYGLSDVSGHYNGALSIAAGFTNSAEYKQKYGVLDDIHFVAQLYHNILDRNLDAAGNAYWLTALTSGQSREHVLVGFADSAEATSNAVNGFTGQAGYHPAWLFLV